MDGYAKASSSLSGGSWLTGPLLLLRLWAADGGGVCAKQVRVEDAEEVAGVLSSLWGGVGLEGSGLLLAVPNPEPASGAQTEAAIQQALRSVGRVIRGEGGGPGDRQTSG